MSVNLTFDHTFFRKKTESYVLHSLIQYYNQLLGLTKTMHMLVV